MKPLRLCLLVIFTFVAGLGLGSAAGPAYSLWINGNPSKQAVVQDKDNVLVPLHLPVEAEPSEWTVSLVRDEKSHRVDVKLTQIKKKLRGDTDCYYCKATGECAQDYPPGSGLNYMGNTDNTCNGTGKCYHCGGTKKL